MDNTKKTITPRQIMFACAAFVQSSSLLTSFFTGVLRQASWIGVLVGYIISIPLILMYYTILSHHPGKNLVQINELIFGRVAGKIISSLFVLYFFSLVVLNTNDVPGFIQTYLMPETPATVLAAIFMLVCVFAVRKGIENVLKYGPLFSIFQLVAVSLFTVLLFKNLNFENFLPLFDIPANRFIQGTNTVVSIPLGELFVFTMIIPNIAIDSKIKKSYLTGMTFGAVVMLLIVASDIAVLGGSMEYFFLPRFEAIRLIDVADVISRMDTLYALVLYSLRFFKVGILLYACALGFSQICGATEYKPFVWTIGILAVMYTVFVFPSSVEALDWGKTTAPIYSGLFVIVLPFIIFISSSIQRAARKKRLNTSAGKTAARGNA